MDVFSLYDDKVPKPQNFLLIKDIEEFCFVEEDDRARAHIHDLISQVQTNDELPHNTANVLSTPDGSCIVSFVKEKLEDVNFIGDVTEDNNDEKNKRIDNEEQKNDSIKDDNIKEIYRAYVYFYTNAYFGKSANKGL